MKPFERGRGKLAVVALGGNAILRRGEAERLRREKGWIASSTRT